VTAAAAGATISIAAAGVGPCSYTAPDPMTATAVITSCAGAATVHVVPLVPPLAPALVHRSILTIEDRAVTAALTAETAHSGGLTPVITTPPARGTLYSIAHILDDSTSTPLTSAGTAVSGAGGYVMYVPGTNGFGVAYDSFEVAFRLNGDVPLQSAPATYTIDVLEVDDLPTVTSQLLSFEEDSAPGGVELRLNLSDAEVGQVLNGFISRVPSRGDLYVVDEHGNRTQIHASYNPFDVGTPVVSQYLSSVRAVSSFWGGPPYAGYHPLQLLGPPDCTRKGECGADAAWVSNPDLFPPVGQRVVHKGLTAFVRAVDVAASELHIEYHFMYKDDANGVLQRCHIDPEGAATNYPADCHFSLVPDAQAPISAWVPRSELGGVPAGVWSPLNKQFTAGVQGVAGGAFGPEYRWGPLDHSTTFFPASGVPYTEWVEVAIAEPVFIFQVIFGVPRGAGAITHVLAQDPTGAWALLYEGQPQPALFEQYETQGLYWSWAPPICRPHFAASVLRVQVDTETIEDWNYIDFIQVVGSRTIQASALQAARPRMVYAPYPNVEGTDSFEFRASDCGGDIFRASAPGVIEFDIRPINDLPTLSGYTYNLTFDGAASSVLHVLDLALIVSDVETDVSELTIEITALPAAGALYENGVQITSPPRTLSATVLQLRIDSIDGLATDDIGSHHYSVVHIGLRVTDPHGGQLVASMPVRIIDSLNRCSPGHILRSMPEGSLCEACEAGKYERDNIFCEQADSLHFVPVGGQTADGLVPCPAHTRHSAIVVEEEGVSVNVQTGASSSAQCSCQQGYYLPSQPAIRANWTGQAGRLVLELTELSSSELVEVLQHAGCVACPKGAVCLGNWLPPIAEAGYAALLEDSFEAFYACTPASSCLPGRHLTARTWLPMQCDAGYQDGSPLCSLCEGSNGYGKTRGECLKCDWPDFVYMIATFGIVIVWFPLMAKLVEMMESLEISFAYLQFLGLYSSFSITWPEPMASLFSGLAFFTLDIDLMHFSCVLPEDDGFHFFVVWAFQAFLPLLFIVLCLVHLAASWIMYRMALAGGLRDLIARGWRPRRQFTFSSVRDTYLPQAVMYMHLYYLTGVAKAFDPLMCEEQLDGFGTPTGKYFLAKSPAMQCFEGRHATMLWLNSVVLLFYVILCPLAYLFIFFVLVPRHGLENPRITAIYGFMWSRFESRVYWWEAIELVRKVGVVVVVASVHVPIPQSILAFILMMIVFSCSITLQPFLRHIYDVFDACATANVMLLILLGVILEGNKGSAAPEEEQYFVELCNILAVLAFVATCSFGFFAIRDDVLRLNMLRRVETLRRSKGLAIRTDLFRLGIGLAVRPNEDIVELIGAMEDPEQLQELRRLEKALQKACVQARDDPWRKQRAEFLCRQLQAEPRLLDWMLSNDVDNADMLGYMKNVLVARREPKPVVGVPEVISPLASDSICLWLANEDSDEDRKRLRDFMSAVEQVETPPSRRPIISAEEYPTALAHAAEMLVRVAQSFGLALLQCLSAVWHRCCGGYSTPPTKVEPAESEECAPVAAPAAVQRGPSMLTRQKTMTSVLSKKKIDFKQARFVSRLETILDDCMEATLAEAVLLIPLAGATCHGVELPKVVLVQGSSEMSSSDVQKARRTVKEAADWTMSPGTPSGVCRETKALLVIDNVLLDRRFRQSFLKGVDALSAISQLCVPVLSEEGLVCGVIKLLNKTSASGNKSGLPFSAQDEESVAEAALAVAKVAREQQQSSTVDRKSTVVNLLSSGQASESPGASRRGGSPLFAAKLRSGSGEEAAKDGVVEAVGAVSDSAKGTNNYDGTVLEDLVDG